MNEKQIKAEYKRLPKEKFGELMQVLYDSECHFLLKWLWDGGIEFSFTPETEEWHKDTLELVVELNKTEDDWARDIEVLGGVIIFEFLKNYTGYNTNGELNDSGKFLLTLGYQEAL